MTRILLGLLFATLAGALTFGAAASLNVNAENLGSGGAEVAACQDSVDIGFSQVENEPQLINGIVVTGVLSACAGQTLSYIVSDGDSVGLVSGEGVLTGDPEQTFTFAEEEVLTADVIGEVGITIAGAAPVASGGVTLTGG